MSVDKNKFALGQLLIDRLKSRKLVYIGYSNWAGSIDQPLHHGAYKFLTRSKRSNSAYTLYLSANYVNNHCYLKTFD